LSAPPDSLAAIGGGMPTSKGEGREWKKGRKGMGRGGSEQGRTTCIPHFLGPAPGPRWGLRPLSPTIQKKSPPLAISVTSGRRNSTLAVAFGWL